MATETTPREEEVAAAVKVTWAHDPATEHDKLLAQSRADRGWRLREGRVERIMRLRHRKPALDFVV
jgi:hypothetical protein